MREETEEMRIVEVRGEGAGKVKERLRSKREEIENKGVRSNMQKWCGIIDHSGCSSCIM